MKTEYRIGLIKLHALETIGATNCNYVGLILPESREDAISALLAYLEENLVSNKVILRLSLIPEDSQFISALRRNIAPVSKNLVLQEKTETLAPYIALPATWDEYFRSLGWRTRRNLKQTLRDLEKEHSTVEFQQCSADSLEEGLSKFFELAPEAVASREH